MRKAPLEGSLLYSRRLDEIIALHPEAEAVLDIGCGIGRNTKYFLDRGLNVYCIDIDMKSLKTLIASEANRHALLPLYCDANFSLPFRDRTFDIIIDSYLYTFIRNRMGYAGEVHRILDENGILLLEFDMTPHIYTHEKLEKYLYPFTHLFKIERKYRIYHEWGNIANEELKHVPAISLVMRPKLF